MPLRWTCMGSGQGGGCRDVMPFDLTCLEWGMHVVHCAFDHALPLWSIPYSRIHTEQCRTHAVVSECAYHFPGEANPIAKKLVSRDPKSNPQASPVCGPQLISRCLRTAQYKGGHAAMIHSRNSSVLELSQTRPEGKIQGQVSE